MSRVRRLKIAHIKKTNITHSPQKFIDKMNNLREDIGEIRYYGDKN